MILGDVLLTGLKVGNAICEDAYLVFGHILFLQRYLPGVNVVWSHRIRCKGHAVAILIAPTNWDVARNIAKLNGQGKHDDRSACDVCFTRQKQGSNEFLNTNEKTNSLTSS
jgi:hypothetical protein